MSRYVENNLIGFIDKKYHIIIKAEYEFVSPFQNNYATFCVGCKKVLLKEGSELIKRVGGKWGIIDKKGNVIVEAIYDNPIIFEKHKAKVTLNGKTFYIDEFGNKLEIETMPNKLIQEIVAIDGGAEEMAVSVLKNPQLRRDLEKKAKPWRKGFYIWQMNSKGS